MRRAVRACAMLGVDVRDVASPPLGERCHPCAAELDVALGAGCVALVTGASGAGKSVAVGELGRMLETRGEPVARADARLGEAERGRAVVDLFDIPVGRMLRVLAWAGLADATLMVRRAGELSEGERFRLGLARGMAAAQGKRRGTLIVDEFASGLDATTAACICRTVRRWAARTGWRAVCVTARDEVMEWLGARVVVVMELGGGWELWKKD